MRQNGTTLMELMVTATIMGVIAALAFPNLFGLYSRMQARSTAEEIASELRLARQLAITHRDRVRVLFDFDQRALEIRFINGATTHHLYRYDDKGVDIEEPSAGPEILFHPSGRSATATTIPLRSREGQVQTLNVGLTGRVSIR